MTDISRNFPETLRQLARHRQFTQRLIDRVQADSRFQGLLLGGSGASDTMDEFSDLDFVVVADPDRYGEVMEGRIEFARGQGDLLSAFVGEHVGEPRLIVCLYGPPLLHVDLKFVVPEALAERVEEPVVLWARDDSISRVLSLSSAAYPPVDPQWVEDRFWVLVHYAASRAERGEVLESAAALGFIAARFLGPLALQRSGAQPNGLRRLEEVAPKWAARLGDLLPEPTPAACLAALESAVRIYRDLRVADGSLRLRSEAEHAVDAYLREAKRDAGDMEDGGKGWAGKHSDRLHRRRGRRP